LDDAIELGVVELDNYGIGLDRGTGAQHQPFHTPGGLGGNPPVVPWGENTLPADLSHELPALHGAEDELRAICGYGGAVELHQRVGDTSYGDASDGRKHRAAFAPNAKKVGTRDIHGYERRSTAYAIVQCVDLLGESSAWAKERVAKLGRGGHHKSHEWDFTR
jgi:hypothetical protein